MDREYYLQIDTDGDFFIAIGGKVFKQDFVSIKAKNFQALRNVVNSIKVDKNSKDYELGVDLINSLQSELYPPEDSYSFGGNWSYEVGVIKPFTNWDIIVTNWDIIV